MEIGTIGAGAFAQAFAKRALKAGHTVKLSNHHGPNRLREIVINLGRERLPFPRRRQQPAGWCCLRFLGTTCPERLRAFPSGNNQILVDGTNPFHGRACRFTIADVGNLSTTQLVAALVPGARVLEALNTMVVPTFRSGPGRQWDEKSRVYFRRQRRRGERG